MSTDFCRDQGGPVAVHNFSSAEWRATQPMSSTRQGPPKAPHLQTSPSQNDNNQCVFLRGLYIKDRSWSQDMKAASRRQDPRLEVDDVVTAESSTQVSHLIFIYILIDSNQFSYRTRAIYQFFLITC